MSRKLDVISVPLQAEQSQLAFPKRPVNAVCAEVTERVAAVFLVPAKIATEMAGKRELSFYQSSNKVPIIACVYRMRHVAPDWAPLEFGPACTALALHLPLVENGKQSTLWIDRRYTDNKTATILSELGFPPVYASLTLDQWQDFEGNQHERFSTIDNRLNLHLAERLNRPIIDGIDCNIDRLFNHVQQSYVETQNGETMPLKLSHHGAKPFNHLPHTHGVIRTLWGVWTIQAVYRSSGGMFIWQTA